MRTPRTQARWLSAITAIMAVALVLTALLAPTPGLAAPPTPPLLHDLALLQPHLFNASDDANGRYGESHAAVNPTNPNNIVATYNQDVYTKQCVTSGDPLCQVVNATIAGLGLTFPEPRFQFASLGSPPKSATCGVFVTFDRGQTWDHVDIPGWPANRPELKDQGDCTVAVGSDGSFYVSFDDLNWNEPSFALPTCGIGITRSADGGESWGNVVLTGTACDGPKAVGDPNDGRVYESSSGSQGSRSTGDPNDPFVFPGSPNDRYLAVSSDGTTWSTPHGFGGQDGATYRSANGLMSAANGTLATAFRSTSGPACTFFVGTGAPCLVFQFTADGGATWTRHAVTNGAAATLQSAVMTAADPSAVGHYTVAGLNASRQFVAFQTTDAGLTWSGPGATVTDSTTLTKGHSWINYSSTGVVGIMWKSNQVNSTFKVYAAFSPNGGTTWIAPGAIEVSDGASPTAPTNFGPFMPASDDYSHIAMGPDVAWVSWADWRPVDRQGFVSAIRFLNYDFGGFLPPITKRATVNAGSTVPIKFHLSVKGDNVSWATGAVTVDGNPAATTGGGTESTVRYDPDAQQYVFNWDTSGVAAGSHTLSVHLDDGTTHDVEITVR